MARGGTPNLAATPATSSVSLLMVLISVTRSLTSCARSLSPVEMTTRWPLSAARRARVPIASSASMPGGSSTGQPSRRTASWIGAICCTSASGIGERLALYAGYQSSRKVRPLASKTQAACSALKSLRRRFNIAMKPCTAPVGKPPGPVRLGIA